MSASRKSEIRNPKRRPTVLPSDFGFSSFGFHRARPASAGTSIRLLVLIVLAMPAPVRAQPEQQKFGFGTHALRRILYETKFKALEDWGDLGNKPNHTLLVVLGGPLSL